MQRNVEFLCPSANTNTPYLCAYVVTQTHIHSGSKTLTSHHEDGNTHPVVTSTNTPSYQIGTNPPILSCSPFSFFFSLHLPLLASLLTPFPGVGREVVVNHTAWLGRKLCFRTAASRSWATCTFGDDMMTSSLNVQSLCPQRLPTPDLDSGSHCPPSCWFQYSFLALSIICVFRAHLIARHLGGNICHTW